ncbi:aminodeoxychorismate synthase component I [Mucilaginibacter sp. MD40]|nr:aminodeoxychorismate synthase component I [Mucilaginibacter sp. MD40]
MQVTDIESFKQKALQWAPAYDTCCYLDSHSFIDPYGKYDLLIAVGTKAALKVNSGSAFEQLEAFRQTHTGWVLGFFGYDLKNETENLSSANTDGLGFPDLYFFVPEIVITIKGDELSIEGADEHILQTIQRLPLVVEKQQKPVNFTPRFNKQEYVATVEHIKRHITRGDIYVTNFCQEFYADKAIIDPLFTYRQLKDISPTPFSTFFKWQGNYILSASPERFLAKRDNKLLSQPIKGTARRDSNPIMDQILVEQLRNHPKELQENVMIVDLVRNDLTRSAIEGTVHAEELYAIQSFAQVHQMVSTVACDKRHDISDINAIKNTFPMGSMTGAPKVSAMQLMEKYERSKRGVYSGALGYFAPDGDFDFNVIIRTLLYNSTKNYLSFHVGSAITYHADAEKEYEECLLKAKAILQALS